MDVEQEKTMEPKSQIRWWIEEFLRYAVVGGISFLIDVGCLWFGKNYIFTRLPGCIYWATAFGFMTGVVANHLMALGFVFRQQKDLGKGRRAVDWLMIFCIGGSGLLFTEFGMWLGVGTLDINYLVVKVLVAGGVLVWNFVARKLTVFR